MKRIIILAALLILPTALQARGAKEKLATPVFRSEGNRRAFYRINIGSVSATIQPWQASESSDRGIIFKSTNPFAVAYASYAFSPATDQFYNLMKSSDVISDFVAGATIYWRLLPGQVSSGTVQVERLYNTD